MPAQPVGHPHLIASGPFHLDAGALRHRPRAARRRKPARHPVASFLIGLSSFCLVSALAWLTVGGGARSLSTHAALPRLDSLLASAGLGLQQVELSGHRFTTDSQIFDALALRDALSLATFDLGGARWRIEQLPWVETAEITRVFPDRLKLKITERTPSAVWAHGGREALIDATGRTLGAIAAGSVTTLPRVVGEGADAHAGAILAVVAGHPVLARRLAAAERVGNRRWTLRLDNGTTLHLPPDGEGAVLAAALKEARVVRQIEEGQRAIDLRAPGRIALKAKR